MKKFLILLPAFFLVQLAQALATDFSFPPENQIDCENDSRLEFYLQSLAAESFPSHFGTFGCDDELPKNALRDWTYSDKVSLLCSFDLTTAYEIWNRSAPLGMDAFADNVSIRVLMSVLQGKDLKDVRCDLNR